MAGVPLLPVQRITVLQGQALATRDPAIEYGTVLGSCVATCLFDPEAKVGGMNHFLLAEPPSSHTRGAVDVHFGVFLMEMLINQMLKRGAIKSRLRAHLYGGANIRAGMGEIGTANARFACEFLERERIPLLRSDLGGACARSVHFRPVSGQVRARQVEDARAPAARPVPRPVHDGGDVELF